jgi:hypothetical protein
MRKTPVALLALAFATACNKPSPPANSAAPAMAPASAAPSSPDAVQLKLQEYAGTGASNCGRFDQHVATDQLKKASDCATKASQSKKPFFVGYDMPGMAVGVAGNSEGKLFTVQMQGGGVTSGACPSQLRVASSGRVTCFAPGDMGSMSGSHAASSMPSGKANPHATGTANPHPAPKSN